ncbi:hypothetical protein MMC28_006654 [Mycoblastus sanguinarius]|nr:hypothetical protein [Mycoblastus sanguinarius]
MAAGCGEVATIVGFINNAAQLSKAIIDIAGKYKAAKLQIESFGRELGILGKILDQLNRLAANDGTA